ncbi:MAG: cupin domain-containing protein [Planctomycetota bacterium]
MGHRQAVGRGGLGDAAVPFPIGDRATGDEVLRGLLDFAAGALGVATGHQVDGRPVALRGCLRGTGPGVSFGRAIESLERECPLELCFPFEGSDRVGGAVWEVAGESGAVAKLRWKAGADDLPIHAHEHSDRVIIVLEGRGFFHSTSQSLQEFDGSTVCTIAARERDVFVFTRGLLHTFSTDQSDMTLISCQMPFVPFEAEEQFTLPGVRWSGARGREGVCSAAVKAVGWHLLAH